ncbi:dihydropyrimidinase [Arthrobacter sp. KNU40]|uniref:dihydropyrimidinase n=1 Tax=Arthrobacter sp. KNU40 TaxID=3447965 RepID=UPI003F62303B
MSVLIRGGRVITASEDYVGDVFIENGVVSLLGTDLDVVADKVIDAQGKYVMPGGIDPHTHIDHEFPPGLIGADDFTSATVAAAYGGTTSVIDFCLQHPGESFRSALKRYHEKIERNKPVIDVGFHIGVTDLDQGGSFEELASLPDEGITSYKLFMAYKGVMADDEHLFKAAQTTAESGALLMVHAENGPTADTLVEQAVKAGHTEPIWHARTRPPEIEAEATNRAIQLAHLAGAPLYVVHVSCEEALEPVISAQEKGWDVTAETCTQYLFIDESYLERPDFEGAKAVFTPPPRPKKDQDILWRALANGTISVLSTDHCPYHFEGQKSLGRDTFTKIPNGAPGIENRLHMLYHYGVNAGRITLNRFVELTSTNAAKRFGMYPRKGTIAPGSDADIVVWDPNKSLTISAATHHSNVDYNLFEGTEVLGAPQTVLVRGQVIIQDDQLVGRPGDGEFVKRAKVGMELAGRVEAK